MWGIVFSSERVLCSRLQPVATFLFVVVVVAGICCVWRWSFCSIDCKRCVAIVALRLWSNDKIDHFLFEWILEQSQSAQRLPLSRPPASHPSRCLAAQQLIYVGCCLCCVGSVACATTATTTATLCVTYKISELLCWVKRCYKSSQMWAHLLNFCSLAFEWTFWPFSALWLWQINNNAKNIFAS